MIVMKRLFILFGLLVFVSFSSQMKAQTFAVKTDALKWATLSFNVEPEVKVGTRSTLALGLSWNPWTFSENKKWKHLLVQPEYRYWLCQPFNGHFFGVHPLYMRFNAGNVDVPFGLADDLKNSRVQGNLWGVGIGYGYHWMLGNRWSLEAEVGLGVIYADYDKYECPTCGDHLGSYTKTRFAPTKLSVSFIYFIK